MHSLLCADVEEGAIPEEELHRKHRMLAFSYPNLFFKTVRKEMDPRIFKELLKLKQMVDDGEIDNNRAKELVIDGAKRHVEEGVRRTISTKHPLGGETVHEINLRCKVEDHDHEEG